MKDIFKPFNYITTFNDLFLLMFFKCDQGTDSWCYLVVHICAYFLEIIMFLVYIRNILKIGNILKIFFIWN